MGVQFTKDADIANELLVLAVAGLAFRRQLADKAQFLESWQHILYGLVHGVEGVDEGAMPIKQDRGGSRQYRDAGV